MEQPVRTVLFVLAQKSIIVIILKALNISTFFCHFILTFRQLYLFRLTQRFFNSTWSATLQWWQLCCISSYISFIRGRAGPTHDHKFQLLSSFFFLLSVWYLWHIFYSCLPTLLLSVSPKCINLFLTLPLSLSSVSSFYLYSLYRGIKLLAIPVTDRLCLN